MLTIEDCDREIAVQWDLLKYDPKASPTRCCKEIDKWLDQRLYLMKERDALRDKENYLSVSG